MKLTENDLIELAGIYNTSGRKTMTEVLKEKYQIKNTFSILKRMAKRNLIDMEISSPKRTIDADDVFMSMDELCSPVVTVHQMSNKIPLESKSTAMEHMIQELIGDRLLELNKYIRLNTTDKIVVIDKTMLSADGYQMVIH